MWKLGVLATLTTLGACSPTTVPDNPHADAPIIIQPMTDGPPGPMIDALGATEACAALATAHCTKLQSCSVSDMIHHWGDIGTCETRVALSCAETQMAPDSAGTPDRAMACALAVGTEACTDFLADGKPPPQACAAPAGPLTGGCAFGAQCTTSFCAVGANALCGQCRDIPTVGTSCATSGCGPTLICAQATHLCQVPGVANSPCDSALPCGNGFSCVGANAAQQQKGTCKAEIAAVNGQCDPTHANRPTCNTDLGLTCKNNQCVTLPHALAGRPCGLVNNVHTDCSAGASCVIPNNQKTGTCVAAAADGAACNTGPAGPHCFDPARCIPTSGTAGTCQLPGSKSCI